ncbi:hypothetical protein B0T17DRAFT_607763 [Bombardia bombarda]|uniref:UBC core domain-containing protein n=1 Tax=Bombardia bombarda TaxID=252184 RepID=A0AA39XBX3_9PEZI|nr:hypothetical protein B0T17DRAFT_607763 [Bombardia bombarda]
MASSAPSTTPALRRRLLRDIAELQEKPYPNIRLHVHDDDITTACLILTPENWKGLHLTVFFGSDYPLRAPEVTIQSTIRHPNIYGDYICASILNTEEGYTPAYTLKGIAIQLLSFFGSDSLEQDYGGVRDLSKYRAKSQRGSQSQPKYRCEKCRFGCGGSRRSNTTHTTADIADVDFTTVTVKQQQQQQQSSLSSPIQNLPDEILLLILQQLEFEDLTVLAQAWPRIGDMITGYDLIRTRELQCYVLKKNYRQVQLGVGVAIVTSGRQGTIQSEFDLVSHQAVHELGVRKSIHGIPFSKWLPLSISHAHWRQVQIRVALSLRSIASGANFSDPGLVLYGFMNDIVVRLNLDLESRVLGRTDSYQSKSTLRHASEKAIESYFHLFHLLLCLATSPAGHGMVPAANRMIRSFMAGKTSKAHVPNLGYLLIALLISDVEVTESLMKAIITEAITRNVVWLLDQKGAGMAELAYLESDEISEYRLKKTFEGSRTSYRLLIFSELFRRTARPSSPSPPAKEEPSSSGNKTSLVRLCDELFARHGAPPPGAAARLASEVRRLQKIDDFPSFLVEMGIAAVPTKRNFTQVLRTTVTTSIERGYSKQGISQEAALALRLGKDDGLDQSLVMRQVDGWGRRSLPDAAAVQRKLELRKWTFFPGGKGPKGR